MNQQHKEGNGEIADELLYASEYAPTASGGAYHPSQGAWWIMKIQRIKELLDSKDQTHAAEIAKKDAEVKELKGIINHWSKEAENNYEHARLRAKLSSLEEVAKKMSEALENAVEIIEANAKRHNDTRLGDNSLIKIALVAYTTITSQQGKWEK